MSSLQKLQPILFEVQQACLQMGLQPPLDVYGSQDETATLMGAVANLAGILLTDSFLWQDLQDVLVLNGDGVRTQYDLPVNFSSIVDSTGWSNAVRRPVVVLNPQQWAGVSSWLSTSFYTNPAARIFQNTIQFMSPPPPASTVTFQYRKSDWVIDGVDPTKTKGILERSADVPRFDWLMMTLAIKVKWYEQKKMDTSAAQSDLNDRYLQLTQRDELGQTLPLSGPSIGGFRYLDNYYNTPDSGIGF